MTLALYRKYRPRTFAEVIGQEHVTEPLSQALRSGRLNHAYLFSGPRGCGKTSSARILARSLNCEQGPTPEPCGECESCRSLAIDGAGSIDVIEIDAASHGGVDDARELRERAFFAPASSRYKIYVIDEAHMVSTQGFNALLKLVEEPPEYVKFIFATTEPDKVLGTIKSRTHHYPFRLIPPGVLRPYLEQLCQAEQVAVDPLVFPLVVRAGGGSARDSLSVLDQLIAGAGPDGVSYARAVALLGVTDAALIDEMCDALAAGDGAAAYATIDRVAEAGHDPRRFASDLLERLRDLIILQQVPDAAAKGLIEGPADQVERMSAQAQRLGPATLSRCADIVHSGLVEMRGTTGPRLLLELICARMLLPGADDSSGALLQRLERMERRLTLGGQGQEQDAGVRPAPVAVPAVAAAPVRPATADDPPRRHDGPAAPGAGGTAVPAAARSSVAAVPGASAARDATQATATQVARGGNAASQPAYPSQDGAVRAASIQGVPAQGTSVERDGRPVASEAIMPDPATPEPELPGAGATPTLDANAVRQVWTEVVGMVNRSNKRIAALVRDAVVRELDGETVVLTFRYPVHAQMVTGQADVLVAALYEQFGGRWQIRCEVAGEQRAAGRPAPVAAAQPPPARSPAARQPGTAEAPTGRVAGDRPAGPALAGRPGAEAAQDNDWPEAARPGGLAATAAPSIATTPSTTAGPSGIAGSSGTAASGGMSPTAAASGSATSAATEPPTTASAAAASGPRSTGTAPGAPSAPAGKRRFVVPDRAAKPAADSAWGDGPPPEEPPYDPEYDGPVRPRGSFEGFDPGDEPLDDVIDEQTARQSGEQQALQLLQEKLGAEKIAEIDAR